MCNLVIKGLSVFPLLGAGPLISFTSKIMKLVQDNFICKKYKKSNEEAAKLKIKKYTCL